METKVGRNDPCPCGSGKKYKKCCGANEVISLSQVVESEIDELQNQLLHFAWQNFGNELEDSFEAFQGEFDLENEAEIEFFEFIHTIWFILFAKAYDDETILDKFIASELRRIKRPKLKQILQSWKDARVIAGKIISIDDQRYTVEDLLTLEHLEVVLFTEMTKEYEEGVFFTGILLPFDEKYCFFPVPFDLPNLEPEDAAKFLEDTLLESGYDAPQEFLKDFFLEMMYELPAVGVGVEIEELEWPHLVYQEVAEIFQNELAEMGEDKELIETGILLWHSFCQKKHKKIKNPNLYVAALYYLMSMIAPMEKVYTQKELAKRYGIAIGSLSSIYREIADVLSEELDLYEDGWDEPDIQFNTNGGHMATERAMQEVLEELKEKNFETMDEINEFLSEKLSSPQRASHKLKDQGQELIYEAFEAEGSKRYRLAEKALELNPNLVDAYNILAENAETVEDAIKMYEKGMWIGQKELGKAFFKENKGHFWGLLETRPYMRAKENYAKALYLNGKIDKAIIQLEELLELNPNDNQGNRFTLFIVYVENGDFTKAYEILHRYEEETAQFVYNELLLELIMHGYTAKAGNLLKQAKAVNKYGIPYIVGKKRIPKVLPEYYGFGDENEAIIYAEAHLHLWREIKGIREWLK